MQALDGVERQRRIHISAFADPGRGLVVSIDDNGPGIPEGIAGRIFDPFFTTKPQGVGTGIGLSISRGLAEAQGGTLTLAVSRQGGAAFELVLPVQPAEIDTAVPAARPQSAVRPPVRAARGCILVIDDEPEISRLLAQAICRAGYESDVASGGRAAQALIDAAPGHYGRRGLRPSHARPRWSGIVPLAGGAPPSSRPQDDVHHRRRAGTGGRPVPRRITPPGSGKTLQPADVVRLVGDIIGSDTPEATETTLPAHGIHPEAIAGDPASIAPRRRRGSRCGSSVHPSSEAAGHTMEEVMSIMSKLALGLDLTQTCPRRARCQRHLGNADGRGLDGVRQTDPDDELRP